jgi:hypothetical protein
MKAQFTGTNSLQVPAVRQRKPSLFLSSEYVTGAEALLKSSASSASLSSTSANPTQEGLEGAASAMAGISRRSNRNEGDHSHYGDVDLGDGFESHAQRQEQSMNFLLQMRDDLDDMSFGELMAALIAFQQRNVSAAELVSYSNVSI